ncbi:MAG: hypothetical protein SPF17_06280 [Candidatus Mucispirillum faecigallinarum]|nr:hypothetical protein [Candidatus Mucispirillum faecigallinarum]
MRYKAIIAFIFIIAAGQAFADTINFGNSFFNKDRANSISQIITIKNSASITQEYSVSFSSHLSMQTSDIKAAPLTDEIFDNETKESFSTIAEDSCIQHYGETLFSLGPDQKCRLHLTFSPTEVKEYNEKMFIRSQKDNLEYNIKGRGILMPDFTVLYYTDNSGENIDNKRAEYSIKWQNETAGTKSDKYAFIKIFKTNNKDTSPLTYQITGDSAFQIDSSLSTCKITENTIEEPNDNPCGIVISFLPNSAGDFSAKLIFNKRILSGAKEYALYGSASDVLDFGTVYFGGNVQKILIPNTSDSDQHYSILSESKDSNFRLVVVNNKNLPSCISNNNDTNFMLQKGQSCYLGFTFAPDRNADFTKKIIIMSNSGERREVTLKGTGIEKLQEN